MDVLAEIGAPSPPVLAPYTSSNDVLPSHLLPCVNVYLQTLSRTVESLEAEIDALEELLRSKKEAHERARKAHDTHRKIIAPVRSVPPEVLGAIFHFAVDTPPFNRYIDVAHLRGVCTSWRRVANMTPGLWTSLHVDLDKWCGHELEKYNEDRDALMHHLKEALAPWIRILSRTTPYNLKLTSSSYLGDPRRRDDQKRLVALLLSNLTPSPGGVTLASELAIAGAAEAPTSPCVKEVQIDTTYLSKMPPLERIFPNLRSLAVKSIFNCTYGCFSHPSLHTLHLRILDHETPESFSRLLQGLPSLRELTLGRVAPKEIDRGPQIIHPHPSLEVLQLEGENALLLFSRVTFPLLRALAIENPRGHTPATLSDEILPRILAVSPQTAFTVSVSGRLYLPCLAQIIKSLPPNSHIHLAHVYTNVGYDATPPISIESDNVEEIFCTVETGNLSWLGPGPARRLSTHPLAIHIPMKAANTSTVQSRRGELERAGYRLEMRTGDEIERMLYSLAPEFRDDLLFP
ncbi:hypothetical protein BKA70DRAFT_1341830 [Coprinopsis sp. MPI-PUGE-AT-0042]|nr:hypothetical protein BKA70DRAFT_1341830 [Coprinopsis sp. MPI-PUGE-AT-0042]